MKVSEASKQKVLAALAAHYPLIKSYNDFYPATEVGLFELNAGLHEFIENGYSLTDALETAAFSVLILEKVDAELGHCEHMCVEIDGQYFWVLP